MLKQRVNTSSKINQMRRGSNTSFLKKLTDDEVHCICEACHNILDENIPMTKNTKFKLGIKLKPVRNKIRKIRNPQISDTSWGWAEPSSTKAGAIDSVEIRLMIDV